VNRTQVKYLFRDYGGPVLAIMAIGVVIGLGIAAVTKALEWW
jgi:hypothetical protein